MKVEQVVLNTGRNVTLTAYLLDVGGEFSNIPRRPAVLVLPGGGYAMCSEREADPVALAYAREGFHTFVLRYSVGKGVVWPQPLEDYERAMEYLRVHADQWGLYPDRVAVAGFSAGGHLAGAAAVLSKNRPFAAVLGYPVLDGETAWACLPTAPDLVEQVGGDTCPCFLFSSRMDNVVPISNTLAFVQALERHGVGFELHIYAYGPHGFSIGDGTVMTPGTALPPRAGRWAADSAAWLRDLWGGFGDGELTAPSCPRRVNDDHAAVLSVDCTVEHLMKNPQAQEVLAPLLAQAQAQMAQKYAGQIGSPAKGGDSSPTLGKSMTLRSALAYGGAPEELVGQLDQTLRRIPNQ